MASPNPYYGQAGGYMADGGGGSQGSPGGQGAKKTTLRPLTCMQAQRAVKPHPDGEFELDGQILNSVTMVAVVRNVSDGASAWTYNLEDGTGSIDARLWKNKGDESVEEAPGVAQDMYVTLMGQLKEFGGKRHVATQVIKPVKDLNQVFYHQLEAMHVALKMTGGAGKAAGMNGKHKADPGASDYAMGAGDAGGGGGNQYTDLAPFHQRIMEAVAAFEDDQGMHVTQLVRQIGGEGEVIMTAIEYLITEGHLYTTIDEFHVKAL